MYFNICSTLHATISHFVVPIKLFLINIPCLVFISYTCMLVSVGEKVSAFVADPVTEALDYVEAIEKQRNNCTFGPTLNLQYSKERWIKEAKITVRSANLLSFLSRTGSHMLGSHPDDVDVLYSIVRANVDNYDKVFGSAIAFDANLYLDYEIFCPYAFKSPTGVVSAKDLSIGYNYHTNNTDWFWVPYKQFHNYTFEEPSLNTSERSVDTSLMTIEDGYWTQPYFDCGGGDVWMVTFSMPFFTSLQALNDSFHVSQENVERVFAGVTTIDLVLDDLDINQCPRDQNAGNDENVFDPFINTHKCHNSTKCVHMANQGFRRGTYQCFCQLGFYFPIKDTPDMAFNGTHVEEEYSKMIRGFPNIYDSFQCLPCSMGCDECMDASPCVVEPNLILRFVLAMVQAASIIGLFALAIYTFIMRENKVFKAASPGLLYVLLLGAAISYCEVIFESLLPVHISCILEPCFSYVGFSLAYGALLFKTWRITVVFKVRSAKPIRITDRNLYVRIVVLLAVVIVFLGAWMLFATPMTTTYLTQNCLKYVHCQRTFWTYIGKAGELLLLAWGVYLCFKVRKAPSAFNESKYISVCIYNETIMALFSFAFVFVLPMLNGGADLFLISEFCKVHVSLTVMVVLLFSSKMYHIYYTTGNTSNKKETRQELRTNKKQLIENGMVYTVDTINPNTENITANPDVQAEVSRMKEVLEEISNAMRLAGIQFQTPNVARKKRKNPEINQGYDNTKDQIVEENTTPRSSSASGSPKKEDFASGAQETENFTITKSESTQV
ncbi:probable G-protein coupled receptor CG31760 [Amphiura filiformis]|uniref:probable G-protein coupled receptor CG31760 n=1 Tax=Amphiura filiformis TaxID=82378 RepID=UPI003B223806